MILGIGTDLCDITRIDKTLQRYGARFLNRVFTPGEQKKAAARNTPAPTLAKRFAAKEACAKALGTGLAMGVYWRDMEVINLPTGQPTLRLTNGAADRLAQLTPPGHRAVIHLALTDEHPLAKAIVTIEALPFS